MLSPRGMAPRVRQGDSAKRITPPVAGVEGGTWGQNSLSPPA
jgi:hypothetical protein